MQLMPRCTVFALSLSAVLGLGACASTEQASPSRAILVSIDSLNEDNLRNTLSAEQVPALFDLFEHGACSAYAQPMFPAVTAAGHATIWTGAYANIHNIPANSTHVLPRDQNTVTATMSGFSSTNLSAEPIWITAGYAGRKVAGHHVTQAPNKAGFPARTGERSQTEQRAFERVRDGYELDNVLVMNGYNQKIADEAVLRAKDVEFIAVEAWQGLRQLGVTVEPRAFRFTNRAGTFYGLLFGSDGYNRLALATTPDLDQAVVARYTDVETSDFADRELARHFSQPLEVAAEQGTTFIRVRLFDVSADGSEFMLYHPALHVIEANHTDLEADYNQYVQGWFGNSATRLYRQGAFGPTLMTGGDGTAEARFMETAELETKLFNRGSEWLWQQDVDLLVDYFPLGDSIDHTFLGYMDEEYPGYSAQLSEQIATWRNRTWELVDHRLAHLMALAGADNSALFVAGDHGMRGAWRQFNPNILLQQAGLQTLDENGMIDLSRTQAVAPTGHWVTLNTTEWRHGIVTPGQQQAVMTAVVEALENATDEQGQPIIERVFIAEEHPELGVGGAAGGDIYWQEAPGYRSSSARSGELITDVTPLGWHSLASTDPRMQTVTCAYGSDFEPLRSGPSQLIDVAPTVADYLNIPAPAQSQGRSLLPVFNQR